MFIISNCHEGVSFNITKRNGRDVLSATDSGNTDDSIELTYTSIETDRPVQYFVFPEGTRIQTAALKPAKLLEMNIKCEQPDRDDYIDEFDLVDEFGDKRAKERVKKSQAAPAQRIQPIKFSIENQIVPPHNKEAVDPSNIYTIDLLFSIGTLESFSKMHRESDATCPVLQHCEVSEDNRVIYNAIDCLYITLSHIFIKSSALLGQYRFFYTEIRDSLVDNQLASISRDQLLAKFYILILMLNNYQVPYSLLPKFNYVRSRTIEILRLIGCDISNSGTVTLKRAPTDCMKGPK